MADKSYDVAIIGGGPGGYVAAIKCAQLGMKTVCIEKRATLGGTCLNVGCIPSKALLSASHKFHEAQNQMAQLGIKIQGVSLDLKTMLSHKDKVVEDLTKGIQYLFKKNNIDYIQGTGSFASTTEILVDGKDKIQAKSIIIATGSQSIPLPGVEVDEKQIVSSTGALTLPKVPEHLVVIGGGYIGLELGSVWMRLGSKVTVIEFADRIVPAMDLEVGQALYKDLQKQGMTFKLNTKVTGVEKTKGDLKVSCAGVQGDSKGEIIDCDVVLSCAGRKPYTEGLNLDKIGVALDERGRVTVNAHFQTSVANIYAIGDIIAGPMLAHKAEEEGVALAEILAGQKPHINYNAIPAVVYTHPEVATVGRTEEEIKSSGVAYKVGKFPFSANARARANVTSDGFVKIITDAKTDEVLGVHIIHADAGTMIAECALAMEYRASAEDIARTCHAHPTTNEAVKEAALAAYSKALHI